MHFHMRWNCAMFFFNKLLPLPSAPSSLRPALPDQSPNSDLNSILPKSRSINRLFNPLPVSYFGSPVVFQAFLVSSSVSTQILPSRDYVCVKLLSKIRGRSSQVAPFAWFLSSPLFFPLESLPVPFPYLAPSPKAKGRVQEVLYDFLSL